VLLAIAAAGAASAAKALDPEQLRPVGLDPTSAYHLAQIVGMVLLYVAVSAPATARPLAALKWWTRASQTTS
jgi:hypothetical protein